MTARLINLSPLVGSSPGIGLSGFYDSFSRPNGNLISGAADAASGADNYWALWLTIGSLIAVGQVPNAILQGVNIFGGELVLQMAGGAGTLCRFACFLTPSLWWGKGISTRAQFSQYKFVGDTSTSAVNLCLSGPVVFAAPTQGGNCYLLQVDGFAGTLTLLRGINPTAYTQLIAPGGPMSVAIGDTVRLEVTPTATTNEINCYRNGVLVGSFSDGNAARPLYGYPGIGMVTSPSNAFRHNVDDYAGGVL